ncbi:hypothetical protein EIN_211610, partial [Entamoeba invadens IP1]
MERVILRLPAMFLTLFLCTLAVEAGKKCQMLTEYISDGFSIPSCVGSEAKSGLYVTTKAIFSESAEWMEVFVNDGGVIQIPTGKRVTVNTEMTVYGNVTVTGEMAIATLIISNVSNHLHVFEAISVDSVSYSSLFKEIAFLAKNIIKLPSDLKKVDCGYTDGYYRVTANN